ncbi:MAG: hypothetical protein GY751_00460 [Bacteroidetes bacterium]|nr:hypothetical protein [Bacteroidota bacterium]
MGLFAQKPEILVQSGHTNRIGALTISSDDKLFATGSIDNTIRIWDVDNGKLLDWYKNSDNVNSLAFYPGDQYLISADYGLKESPLKVWKIGNGAFSPMSFYGGAMDLQLSNSGKYLVSGSSRGKAAFWNMETTEGLWYYDTQTDASIKSLAFSDDEMLVTGGTGGFSVQNQIYTWSTDSNHLVSSVEFESSIVNVVYISEQEVLVEELAWGNTNKVYKVNIKSGKKDFLMDMSSIVVYRDKSHLVGQTAGKTISIVDIHSGNLVRNLEIKEGFVDKMALTTDNQKLILVGRNIEAIDPVTGESFYYIEGDRWIEGMSFAPSGNRLAFSGDDDEIIFWDVREGDVDIWKGHDDYVTDLFFDQQGNYLASASRDTTVIVWNPDGTIKQRFKFYGNEFHTVSMNPSADWLTVSEGDTVYSIAVEEGYLEAKSSFLNVPAEKVIYSPNNKDIGYLISNYLLVWDAIKEDYRVQLSIGTTGFEDIAFSGDGRYVAAGGYNDSLIVWDLDSNKMQFLDIQEDDHVISLSIDPTSLTMAAGYDNGVIRIFNIITGKKLAEFKEHGGLVNKLSFRDDGAVLASSSWDGQLILWNMETLEKLAELYAFEDGTWAVIDDAGRYDASNGGNIPHLHFVANGEVISLDQLKERFYEPGLLQKLLGYRSEPLRDVSKLSKVMLYPIIDLSLEENKLTVEMEERNGGIGRVQLFVNDKEVEQDVSADLLPGEDSLHYSMTIDLSGYSRFFDAQQTDKVSIVAFNEEGYLSSPRTGISYHYVPEMVEQKEDQATGNAFTALLKPKLYGIVIGTADYRGNSLDLKFADKDARDFSSALEQVGNVMFGNEFVKVETLFTGSIDHAPTKTNIQQAFEEIAGKATSKDVLVVYMSGHGMNYQSGSNNQFHYLTMDMESGNIDDEVVRRNYTVSTEELSEWIASIPVQKQVLILDACSSGQAIEDILVTQKSVTSGQVRALERLKDRTGMFVLTGSASDKVSFEASRFGQSLLTYSLLSGMKGQALRDGAFVDVLNLFEHSVDQVPELAEYIGGIQKPILAVPYGGNSFDIGLVDESVHIELATIKPVFIRSNFQDEMEFADVLGLSDKIDELFRTMASRAKSNGIIFVDVNKYPDAYSIKGRYTQEGEMVKVSARVFKSKQLVGSFEVEGSNDDVDGLTDLIITHAKGLISE